jgi:outer membrane protein assembly factor BamB
MILLSLVATGCVGTRIGVSWSATQVITLYGQERILVAYNNILTLVDADTGAATRLQSADGQIRLDDSGNPRLWFVDGNSAETAQFFTHAILNEANDTTTLILPAYNNRVLKVDLPTARLDTPSGTPLSGPVIANAAYDNNTIYLGLKLRDVVALDRQTLRQKWVFNTKAGVWAAPILADGVLYVATIDHFLHALNAETGQPVWEKPVNLEGLPGAAPLLHEGHLYIGSYSHTLFKISLQGEIVGRYKANNWIWSTPTLYDGLLYLTDLSGSVHAINPETMSATWSVRPSMRGIRPAPVVTERHVIVAARDGIVYWLDRRDGATLFSREIADRPEILSDILYVPANPQRGVLEDLIVVSTTNIGKLLAAFTVENGRAAWVYGR